MSVQLIVKMIIATVTALFTAIGGMFAPVESSICFIGHRGYSGKYPQNTALAFKKAAENGFGGCETDVRITKDGVYVLSHDSSAVLKDGTELEVAEHTFAELTAQPLKNRKTLDEVYLCTYKEYLEIMRDNNMICFIELKGNFDDSQVKEIFDIAAQTYDLKKCILQSFEFDNLLKARALFPDLPLMLTYGSGDTGYEKCFDYGISIDADYKVITEEMIKEFHDRGLEVGLWTANDIFSMSYCKSLGVDYIESDNFSK
ncbi:MAG: hypothetical protein IKS39_10815 [Clostridia bacterium]|nr:hypothetical protein [Clostridia bacterium]